MLFYTLGFLFCQFQVSVIIFSIDFFASQFKRDLAKDGSANVEATSPKRLGAKIYGFFLSLFQIDLLILIR